jgi:tyrosine-protein kinase Etk/Wzc
MSIPEENSYKADISNLAESENEISLFDMLIALGEEKKWVTSSIGIGLLISFAMALISPNKYTAKTVLMPPQQGQSAAASALASLGSLAGLAGGAAGIKSQDELYIALLKSDRLQNSLIQRFSLQERYEVKFLADARKNLDANLKVAADKKSGLITVEVADHEPKFAAQMANAYVEELSKLLGSLAVSEAQQRRQFFEQRVLQIKNDLAKSEINFRQAQAQSGMQVTQALAETGVRASVELRQQIAMREVQLLSLRTTYATEQNPDAVRLSREIAALRVQLAKTEKGADSSQHAVGVSNGVTLPTNKDSAGQDAVRAYRDVKVQEAMLDVMIRQYELARVDESKEGPLLQQIDIATPPESKSAPKRSLIVLGGLMLGLFAGLAIVAIRRFVRSIRMQPDWPDRSSALSQAWRMRRRG